MSRTALLAGGSIARSLLLDQNRWQDLPHLCDENVQPIFFGKEDGLRDLVSSRMVRQNKSRQARLMTPPCPQSGSSFLLLIQVTEDDDVFTESFHRSLVDLVEVSDQTNVDPELPVESQVDPLLPVVVCFQEQHVANFICFHKPPWLIFKKSC